MDTFLLCAMFARLSELRSVLQVLIPELIMSQICHTVYVHMGPICNSCGAWSSWSVVAHFTHDVVKNTSSSHLWDCDNSHGTVESNYQHNFSVNMCCGVMWCHCWPTHWSIHFLATSDRWYLCQLFARRTASTLRECSSINTITDVLPAWWSAASF